MNKLHLLTFFVFLAFSFVLNGQRLSTKVADLESRLVQSQTQHNKSVDSLNSVIIDLLKDQDRIEKQYHNLSADISRQSNGLSNQLDGLGNSFTFWGIVFSVLFVGLAAYISYTQYQMTRLLKATKSSLLKIKAIKKDIDGSMEFIYENVRNKELETILDRIKREPQDIQHFMPVLTSRDIPDKFFSKFNQLSEFLEKGSPFLMSKSLVLVVQHFPDQLVDTSFALDRVFKNWSSIGHVLYHSELGKFLRAILKKTSNSSYSKSKETLTNMCTAFNGMGVSRILHATTIIRKEYDKDLIFKLSRLSKENNLERIGYCLGTEILQNYSKDELSREDQKHYQEIIDADLKNVPENLIASKPRQQKVPNRRANKPSKK